MLSVVYIGGYGRSGSTILEMETARRLGGLGAGELSSLFDWAARAKPCSCGKVLHECPIWGHVLSRSGRFASPSALADPLWQAERGTRRTSREQSSVWFKAWTEVLRALDDRSVNLVVDSSKTAGGSRRARLMAQLSEELGFPFFFLHMSRDPRGVMYSTYTGGNRDMESGAAPGSSIMRSARSGIGWTRAETQAMLNRRDHGGDRSFVVRYEEFVEHTDRVMDEVEDAARRAGIRGVGEGDIGHGIAGNRLRRIDPAPDLVIDDRWRGALPVSMRSVGQVLNGYRSWTTRSLSR